jgi:hypothetical protein
LNSTATDSGEIAAREGQTAGQVLSELARRGLKGLGNGANSGTSRCGVPLLPTRGEVITLEHVRALMDSEGV